MEKQLFVTESIAKTLEKKGFDVPCIARYSKGELVNNRLGLWYNHNGGEINDWYISAPMIDQVEDWLEEKHNICIDSTKLRRTYNEWYPDEKLDYWESMVVVNQVGQPMKWKEDENRILTRRQARLRAIRQALELI